MVARVQNLEPALDLTPHKFAYKFNVLGQDV